MVPRLVSVLLPWVWQPIEGGLCSLGCCTGEIIAMFGVDCHSGDTFTDGNNVAMTSMFCPEPVISYSINAAKSSDLAKLSRVRIGAVALLWQQVDMV